MLNESISTVNVLIKTKNLLEKIDGGDKQKHQGDDKYIGKIMKL